MMEKKEDLMTKIDYISADNGGLALSAGNVTIRANTAEAIAEAMINHGLAETVMGSSSMDFASEEGFETNDGALNMWNEAIGIYNWEVNGVAS
jgi:hypothetical protein